MTSLLAISLGPVQDFIAAARRTADLHAGSELLVAVVGAAANTFTAEELIFPTNPQAGGANKILAVVSDDPAGRAETARQAAVHSLTEAWSHARQDLTKPGLDRFVDWERADEQITDFLEFYAAWTPLVEYAASRTRVERLLAARKALRNFRPLAGEREGYPRSALDPSRASVVTPQWCLRVPQGLQAKHPLWLKKTEVLDAVSLLKRLRGPALRGDARTVLSTRDLAQRGISPGYLHPRRSDKDPEGDFEPTCPYYAVLVADGDRMGKLLNALSTQDQHRNISTQLDAFADQVRGIVEQHDGQFVYSGGDDVLALLPIRTVVDCARDLAQRFVTMIPAGPDADSTPTLSVGVAIIHYLEPLSVALRRGRASEADAKVERNCLSITVHTRGGAPVSTRQSWPAAGTGSWPQTALERWLERAHQDQIGRGVPYELGQLADEWSAGLPGDSLRAEVLRILRHKDEGGRARPTNFARTRHSVEDDLTDVPLADAADLRRLADQLLVARFLTKSWPKQKTPEKQAATEEEAAS